MNNFLDFYQHIPERIDPNISLGIFDISWYSLMYLVGFGVVYALLRYRIRKRELGGEINSLSESLERDSDKLGVSESSARDSDKEKNSAVQVWRLEPTKEIRNEVQDKSKLLFTNYYLLNALQAFLLYALFGLLIGARLGYVLFYDLGFYLNNPLAIVSPYDSAGNFIGIYGMSYHGGLGGAFLASLFFLKKYKINFWVWADFVAPAIPAGYFFGRMGNFLNGELYGRITQKPWGMYFLDENSALFPYLRHPSQLYEAFLEGVVLFALLWFLRDRTFFKGKLLGIYFIGYALARFVVEFFREPDGQIGFVFSVFTMGQLLSLTMSALGIALLLRVPKK